MREVAGKEGVWRLEPHEKLLGVRLEIFEEALPPLPDGEAIPGVFGVVGGRALQPKPAGGGMYIVQAEGDAPDQVMRILAYLDRYGRAFACNEPQKVPPARTPDLMIDRNAVDGNASQKTTGTVYVPDDEGRQRRAVATYERDHGRYSVLNTWYDFGAHGKKVPYREFMTRAFLALSLRPSLGAPAVPSCCVEKLLDEVHRENPLACLARIVGEVRDIERDPQLRVPALVSLFVENLEQAGIDRIVDAGVAADALRLVPSTKYAHMHYLSASDEKAGVSRRELWGLEGALNRLRLSLAALGEDADGCDEARCRAVDEALFENVGTQAVTGDVPEGAPRGSVGGDWDLRCRLSCLVEQLRLPVRVGVDFRLDWPSGAISLLLKAPDASLMPRDADALACARRYAMHVGLLLASRAFGLHDNVKQVRVAANPIAPCGDEAALQAFFDVAFTRELWEELACFDAALKGDPLPALRAAGARFDGAAVTLPASDSLHPAYEAWRSQQRGRACELPPDARLVLGARSIGDLNVEYDTDYRRMAEDVAGRLSGAKSATEAIRVVRDVSDRAVADRDERAVTACARLMSSLAEGSVDAADENAVVGRFLGEDRCSAALSRARALESSDPDQAISVLAQAISEAQLLDGVADGASAVYRYFDGYASRVLYNLARLGRFELAERVKGDVGKQVLPAPDSYFMCHIEIVRLLEQSFSRTDEALRYGTALLSLAPSVALAYRVVGRAYMLTGDADRARSVLAAGLRVAMHPTDVALLYYQLAYVLWKAGETQGAVACYLKSVATAPTVAIQAMAELRELISETGCAIVPHEELDLCLEAAGVPLAPDPGILDAFESAAVAAADAGLVHVARSVLAVRLRYRPDDVLMGVLRSFGE